MILATLYPPCLSERSQPMGDESSGGGRAHAPPSGIYFKIFFRFKRLFLSVLFLQQHNNNMYDGLLDDVYNQHSIAIDLAIESIIQECIGN